MTEAEVEALINDLLALIAKMQRGDLSSAAASGALAQLLLRLPPDAVPPPRLVCTIDSAKGEIAALQQAEARRGIRERLHARRAEQQLQEDPAQDVAPGT